MKADMRATARALSPNTIMIYASAPSFPHGIIDPVEALGKLAAQHGVSFFPSPGTFDISHAEPVLPGMLS